MRLLAPEHFYASVWQRRNGFANPAASLARTLTTNDALSLSSQQAAAAICAQFLGVLIAAALFRRISPRIFNRASASTAP